MASTDFTPNLELPYLLSNQAQKHVTLNESLRALDGLVHLAVRDRDANAPPGTPQEGARYLIANGASGDWTGHDGDVSFFADGGWLFLSPQKGWTAYVEDEDALIVHDGSSWRNVQSDALQNLTRLGLNAVADAGNPMLIRLNDALFTADEASNGGTGDLRLKLNKETSGDVLSLLLQTGYSSRAEIGLVGDDDLVVKVSPDGSVFREALRMDKTSGEIRFPSGHPGLREQLTADRTYYVRVDGDDGNDGLSDTSGGAFASIQHAVNIAETIDAGNYTVTIQVGPGSYAETVSLVRSNVGTGLYQIVGDPVSPANVELSGFDCRDGASWKIDGFRLTSSPCLDITLRGRLLIDHIHFAGVIGVSMNNGNLDATNASLHVEAGVATLCSMRNMSYANFYNAVIDLASGIDWGSSGAFFLSMLSSVWLQSASWTGTTPIGKRFKIALLSAINTAGGGDSFIPGGGSGLITGGSQYA